MLNVFTQFKTFWRLSLHCPAVKVKFYTMKNELKWLLWLDINRLLTLPFVWKYILKNTNTLDQKTLTGQHTVYTHSHTHTQTHTHTHTHTHTNSHTKSHTIILSYWFVTWLVTSRILLTSFSLKVNQWNVPAGRPTLPVQVKVTSVYSVTFSELGDTTMGVGAFGAAEN